MTRRDTRARVLRLEEKRRAAAPDPVRVTVTRRIVDSGEEGSGPQVCRTERRTFCLYPEALTGRRRAK